MSSIHNIQSHDSVANEVNPAARPSELEETEPDGGYGWICVAAMLFITANTWGVNGSFGVYLAHYIAVNSFPGTSQITYAFIGGLSISQITFIAPLVTYVGKRLGTHATLTIGIVLETAALILSSFATKVWHLFLTQGILFAWGSGFLYVGAVGIVPQWFTRRRSVATAIAAAGSGLGGLSWSLGSEAMIQTMGLSWSFRITAILTCILNGTCTILMKDRNKIIAPSQKAFDVSFLKQYSFLCIVGWAYCSTLGYTLVLFSIPANALSIGLSARQGALAGALANLGMAIGRPLVGYFSTNLGTINMITAATFACSLFCLSIWTSASSQATLFAFAFLGGSVCGTYYAMIAPLLTDVFGIKLLPASLSIMWTLIVLPTTFAEPIGQALSQGSNGHYLSVQLFTGFIFLGGTGFMLLLRVWAVRNLTTESQKENEKEDNGDVKRWWNIRRI